MRVIPARTSRLPRNFNLLKFRSSQPTQAISFPYSQPFNPFRQFFRELVRSGKRQVDAISEIRRVGSDIDHIPEGEDITVFRHLRPQEICPLLTLCQMRAELDMISAGFLVLPLPP